MAKFNQDTPQFGSPKPANTGGSQHCAQCERMLADALDETLSAEDQALFDQHMAGCDTCSQMLADAKRGAAWLEMLRTPRPEPPAALLERILARTLNQPSDQSAVEFAAQASALLEPAGIVSISTLPASTSMAFSADSPQKATILPFRRRVVAAFQGRHLPQSVFQPRLAMTAAMAFFSIALTLNLTGVHLNQLRTSDLKPSSLRRNFYQANASVVRYYDNLRVVYELESRVRDLQRSNDNDTPATPTGDQAPAPQAQPDAAPGAGQPDKKQTRPRPNTGTSRRQGPDSPFSLPAAFHFRTGPEVPRWSAALSPVAAPVSTTQKGDLV